MANKVHSAEEILGMKEPGDLFTGDPNTLKAEYRALVKAWHTDTCKHPKADEVMQMITGLYAKAEDMLQKGDWKRKDMIRFIAKDGKVHEIVFRVAHDFELGKMYIGNNVVTYVLPTTHREMFENARRAMNSFTFANSKMESEFMRFLPKIVGTFETNDDKLGLVVAKTPDLILLRDVLDYFGGRICERHTAWIESSLLNLACYLDFAKMSHNAITLDTYFISPSLHGGSLLGGWWYSVGQGSKLLGVPSAVYSTMPPAAKVSKTGNITTDLECARLVGRQLLGDPNGTRLLQMKAAPAPMISWLRGVAPERAIDDYKMWGKVLTDSFGQRKYVPMDLTSDMVYPKNT